MSRSPAGRSIYSQVAQDIAASIVVGRHPVGETLKGRSTLAGHYKVSPETIRRALMLLETANVVEVRPGVGAVVASQEHAKEFLHRSRDMADIDALRGRIQTLMGQQREIGQQLAEAMRMLLDAVDRFNYLNPLVLYELEVEPHCTQKGKTIGELNFWRNTGTTIVAIRRRDSTLLSPGPDVDFREGDVLLIVGDEASYGRAKQHLYPDGVPKDKKTEGQ